MSPENEIRRLEEGSRILNMIQSYVIRFNILHSVINALSPIIERGNPNEKQIATYTFSYRLLFFYYHSLSIRMPLIDAESNLYIGSNKYKTIMQGTPYVNPHNNFNMFRKQLNYLKQTPANEINNATSSP